MQRQILWRIWKTRRCTYICKLQNVYGKRFVYPHRWQLCHKKGWLHQQHWTRRHILLQKYSRAPSLLLQPPRSAARPMQGFWLWKLYFQPQFSNIYKNQTKMPEHKESSLCLLRFFRTRNFRKSVPERRRIPQI